MLGRCEIRWCKKESKDLVSVTENIGDGAFLVEICSDCYNRLGQPSDLPEPDKVRAIIKANKMEGEDG